MKAFLYFVSLDIAFTLERLNLPEYHFKIKEDSSGRMIFDSIRKKWVKVTPEEWVRQNFTSFLVQHRQVPGGLIAIEKSIKVNGLIRRYDMLIFGSNGNPLMLVECKASRIKIDQKVFDQIAQYNIAIGVPYLIVTNGLQHFICQIDHLKKEYHFLHEIPSFLDLNRS